MDKQKELDKMIEDLKLIHESLKSINYCDLHTDDSRQHLLVSILIHMKKDWYFAEQKELREQADKKLAERNKTFMNTLQKEGIIK